MDPDDFYYLGKILKGHGTHGHLIALLEVDDPGDYQNLKSVYIDLAHERIPFFIESVELLEKKKVILKIQDVTTPDHANAFAGRELYLPLSSLPELNGNRFYYHEVKGFRIIDEVLGELGIIEDILELPRQSLFQVRYQDKELLIPVVDEVIREVDRTNQTIYICAPEGLIDIYT